MKPFVFVFSMFVVATLFGCTNDNKAIAEGNVEKLCKKAFKLEEEHDKQADEQIKEEGLEDLFRLIDESFPEPEKDMSKCIEEVNKAKEKDPEKFKEIAKVVSEADRWTQIWGVLIQVKIINNRATD